MSCCNDIATQRQPIDYDRKLLKRQGFVLRVIVADKLKSYEAANKQVMKSVEHRQHKGLNNRAENSHQPTRTREQRMRRFKSPGQAQRFLSAFGPIREHFHPKQHQLTAQRYREQLRQRFEDWREVAGLVSAAESHGSLLSRDKSA
jgi:putative transposase